MKQFRNRNELQTKPLPSADYRKFGITDIPIAVKNLDDLKKSKFNIVIAQCLKECEFSQNQFVKQILKKKQRYVMGVSTYRSLWYNPYTDKQLLKPATIKFNNVYKPYNGQNLDNKILLVSRTGGIGDLLFIQPNLIYLKQKHPTCKIIISCGPQYHSMVNTWECIDEVLLLPFDVKYLLKAHYHAFFEGVIERCEEATTTNAYNLFSRWLGLNLPDDFLIPNLKNLNADKLNFCKEYLNDRGIDEFILVQMKASSPIRTPSPKVWTNILTRLTEEGYPVIITDTPNQSEYIDDFIKKIDTDRIFNFSKHSKTLDYSIALTSLASCTVSPDSSLIHIAAGLDIPSFGLYGPFPGEIRLTTYPKAKWINAEKKCAPCFKHGHKACMNSDTNGYSTCYNNLDIENCIRDIMSLI